MKATFLRLERVSTGASMALACAMLALAATLGLFQILTRFVLERPAEWTEVLIRFSLIWMVFLGIPTAFRIGAMVSVDALYRATSGRARRALDWVVFLCAFTLVGIILWWGWSYSLRGRVQTVIGLESISMFWAYLAMPVGAVFSLIALVGNLLQPQRNELDAAQ